MVQKRILSFVQDFCYNSDVKEYHFEKDFSHCTKSAGKCICLENEKNIVRYSPLNAVVFACIFQDKDKAGTAMSEFLNAVLDYVNEEPIVEIIDMKSEYPVFGTSADDKYGRLDVRVKAESGRLFDIEVQIEKDYMNERGFFYGGRLGEDEFKPNTPYDKMPSVRVINIVDFYVRDDKRFVVEPVEMTYRNNPGEVATEKFKMYHIQLPAFRKEHKTLESVKGDTFNSWLYTFDRGYQSPEEMEVLSSMSEGLRNFAAQYHYAIHDPDLIRHYRMIEDGKRDVATQISVAETKARLEGEREGRREGRREGKLEATKENARRMKAKGYPSADIAEITGLSVADIEKLA